MSLLLESCLLNARRTCRDPQAPGWGDRCWSVNPGLLALWLFRAGCPVTCPCLAATAARVVEVEQEQKGCVVRNACNGGDSDNQRDAHTNPPKYQIMRIVSAAFPPSLLAKRRRAPRRQPAWHARQRACHAHALRPAIHIAGPGGPRAEK